MGSFLELWDKFYMCFEHYLPLLPQHNVICNQLINNQIDSSPNILTYGATGFPHMLLIEYAISKIVKCPYPITKRTHLWECMPYIETDYYFELDMSHPEFPRKIESLVEFLLSIINNRCIYLPRHIFILKNIDVIHRNNPQAFRVILERFSDNVMFIATTHKINFIESPIISRMLTFRVPVPTEEEQKAVLHMLTGNNTIRYTGRNLIKNIFFNEDAVMKQTRTIPTLMYPPLKEFIDATPYDKEGIRKFAYKLYQHSITIPDIVRDLMKFVKDEHIENFVTASAAIELMACHADESKVCFFLEYILYIYCNGSINCNDVITGYKC